MVRKAKLDKSEAPVAEDVFVPVAAEVKAVPGGEEECRLADSPPSFRRWLHGRRLLAAAGACIVLVLVVVVACLLWSGKTAPPRPPPAAAPVRFADTVYLKNFVIDCMDGRQTLRIAMCDVALLLAERRDVGSIEGNTAVRDAVYRVARGSGGMRLAFPEQRTRVKKEIGERVNDLLGQDVVRGVYFTKLVIF
jgi:flagellar basal body-associated protein FliL